MLATLPLAFLGGLAGSLHCAGMCGGFSLGLRGLGGPPWRSLALYHLARVNTYMGLGTAAGAVGAAWVASGPIVLMERALALLVGGLLVWMGAEGFGLVPRRVGSALGGWHTLLVRSLGAASRTATPAAPIALGVLNAFLPCHLLVAALSVAAATGSVRDGGLTMLAFGSGTVPILVAVGAAGQVLPGRAARHTQTLIAATLVLSGGVTIARAFAALCLHHL